MDRISNMVSGWFRQAVVWNYDIFGFDAGRTRQMCDLLAASGYLVALPDYYRGTFKAHGYQSEADNY
jgi:dienelactone hydrolase